MNNLAEKITSLSHLFNTSTLAMADYSTGSFRTPSQNNSSFQSSGSGSQFKKFQRLFKKSPLVQFLIIVVIVFAIAIFGITIVIRKSTTDVTPSAASTAKQISVAKPLATETLNKSFDFPLKDATGKTVSTIHYEIQSAEFDNQVIIKGQQATAVAGKTFLVLNLKIDNDYSKAVELNTRDYVRLIVNGNKDEKLAADIHNDPVDVEAISTKFTRIGFPVDTNAKSLVLEVGEIQGSKQTIQLNLK